MRDKNRGIYQFILDLERKKNRERVLREKIQREEFLGPTEQPVMLSQDIMDIYDKFRKEKPLSAGIFEFGRKGGNLGVELGISIVLAACSFISIVVLFQIDSLVHQNLYSYGLQAILKLLTPCWIAVNAALGMFWLIAIATILFRMHVLTHKSR